jgi:hypothetical protein
MLQGFHEILIDAAGIGHYEKVLTMITTFLVEP